MSRVAFGIIVGIVAASAIGIAVEPAVRARFRAIAGRLAGCCDGQRAGSGSRQCVDLGRRALGVEQARYDQAVAEGRTAAAERRQQLWARFETARDSGRADVDK